MVCVDSWPRRRDISKISNPIWINILACECRKISKLPDIIRHRFATAALNRWMEEGKDLYAFLPYLRAFMGHNDLSATAYYIHLLPENLVKSSGIDWASFSALLPEVEV